MNEGIIGLIGIIVGGIIAGLFKWISSTTTSSIDDRSEFRKAIMKRLEQVEEKTKLLEQEVTIWKIRYWSLYARTLERYNVAPPDFHKMDLSELEEGYKKAVEKLNENIPKS
ncbi:hypothetical protein [Fodinibius sp.]|uniref:hypothetical protein n=1 Tax=Fodinibius sp. TaxID=1872440 RepID=UPI002ACD8A81|nr:hypothetical protein [Fodinibius sp.]MDZ7658841.1 hypothetical protein [Fodinibius sp.]